MNREEFMSQLGSLLQNIAPTEREEALQYYNDYFDDAGEENEQEVIEALGNPARVAETIKRDLLGGGQTRKAQASDRALMEYGQKENTQGNYQTNYRTNVQPEPPQKSSMPGWAIALLVTFLVLFSPGILGVSLGLLGILAGILITWFALIASFGVVAVSLFVVLLVLVILGVMCLFINPWVGLALAGGGLVCGGVGILFLMLTVAMAGIVTPAVCKGIVFLFDRKTAKT